MNRIWSSSYGDNNNIKRISDRVNFRIGQTVYGKLVKKVDVNQAIIRLLNGLELEAEVQEGIDEFKQGLLKFQVQGLKDNKLQLKLFSSENGELSKKLDGELMSFILKEGLSQEDLPMLEKMLKYELPLTKENVGLAKSILQFSEKINNNADEMKMFIDKYLNSKDISPDSARGKEVSNMLNNFLKEFKNMSQDEILLFMENDVEFSKENINSYKALFKGDTNIFDVVKDLDSSIDDANTIFSKTIVEGEQDEVVVNKSGIDINKVNVSNGQFDLESDLAREIESTVNMKNIDNIGDDRKNANKEIINIFRGIDENISPKQRDLVYNMISKLPLDKLDKEVLEKVFSQIIGKNINISDESFEKILKALVQNDDKDLVANNSKEPTILNDNKESSLSSKGSEIKEQIASNLNTKNEEAKEVVKKLITLLSQKDDGIPELMNSLKDSMQSVKLFNKFSEQYYYMDFPVNFNEQEYPCKLIIKDNRKDGKQIDSKNLKLALTVKTANFGTVDSLVKVLNRTIDIQLKCNEEHMKVFEASKGKLKNIIESLGFFVGVQVSKKEEELSLTSCREFFGENNVAGIDIKV